MLSLILNGRIRVIPGVWLDNELIINAASAPLGGKPTTQYSFKFGPYRNDMPPNRRAPDIKVYYAGVGLEGKAARHYCQIARI